MSENMARGILVGHKPTPEGFSAELETVFGEKIIISLSKPSFLQPRTEQDAMPMIFAGFMNEIQKLQNQTALLTAALSGDEQAKKQIEEQMKLFQAMGTPTMPTENSSEPPFVIPAN